MDKQIKFLSKQYLETRISELKEVRRKEVKFYIKESDRAFSKTLYIEFFCSSGKDKWYKQKTIRISDHLLTDCPHIQFIIEPDNFLTKKKKQQFMKILENAVKKSKTRQFYKELDKISTQGENNE